MTAKEILAELKSLGSEATKKVLKNHGVKEPFFGVKIGDMKPIQKRIKKDYQLALDLFDTGNYDAMYLAGLIADDEKMTKKDLNRWVEKAGDSPLCGFTVPWVAAGSPHGYEIAMAWIDSKKEHVAVAGWTTLGCIVALKPDSELDLAELKRLLARAQKSIHEAPNKVRYTMNNFVISLAIYVKPLSDAAVAAAKKIGKVSVDMGDTACQVPYAPDYIEKARARGNVGKKRKTVKC
jgi:3-methyladenine DNA glycosylase AlkD